MTRSINNSNKPNYFYISVLTVFSSLAVVFLHCNGVFWKGPSENTWLTANIIETLFYFVVPVFFMISGCTLIDYKKRYSTKDFFIKRTQRTVVPYILWSLIAFGYALLCTPNMHYSLIGDILNHRYMGVYWFFNPLFAVYLCIPVLANVKHKVRTFTYMVSLGLITICSFDFLRDLGVQDIPIRWSTPICGGFLVYPLLGYILHHTELTRRTRIIIYTLGLASTISHFAFTYALSPEGGKIFMAFKNYLHITTVLQASAIFIYVKYNAHRLQKHELIHKTILHIQPATLGIYLTHMYAIEISRIIGINLSSILFRTFGALIIYILIALVIRQLQKVRWMRIFFP